MSTKKAKAQETLSEVPKVQYDPKKQWQWSPDSKFEFTGIEFHKINTALSEFIVSDMSVPTILKLAEAFTIIQAKMTEYVDNGTIVEMPVQE